MRWLAVIFLGEASEQLIRNTFWISGTIMISEMWYPKHWVEKSETFVLLTYKHIAQQVFISEKGLSIWNPKQLSDMSFGYLKVFPNNVMTLRLITFCFNRNCHCDFIGFICFFISSKMTPPFFISHYLHKFRNAKWECVIDVYFPKLLKKITGDICLLQASEHSLCNLCLFLRPWCDWYLHGNLQESI